MPPTDTGQWTPCPPTTLFRDYAFHLMSLLARNSLSAEPCSATATARNADRGPLYSTARLTLSLLHECRSPSFNLICPHSTRSQSPPPWGCWPTLLVGERLVANEAALVQRPSCPSSRAAARSLNMVGLGHARRPALDPPLDCVRCLRHPSPLIVDGSCGPHLARYGV